MSCQWGPHNMITSASLTSVTEVSNLMLQWHDMQFFSSQLTDTDDVTSLTIVCNLHVAMHITNLFVHIISMH